MVMEIIISVILLFVGIAILVVIHVCIVGRVFQRVGQGSSSIDIAIQRRIDINNNNNHTFIGAKRLSTEDLKGLPCYDFNGGGRGDDHQHVLDCAVCLENFQVGDKCRLLPNCGHSFHARCIDSWLLKTPICPICRSACVSNILPNIGVNLEDEISTSAV